MTTMIDPRPMEPAWVTDMRPEPSGLAEWTIYRDRWNKEEQRYTQARSSCEGSIYNLLTNLAEILGSDDPECWIKVNAEQCIPEPTDHTRIPNLPDYSAISGLFARVTYDDDNREEFTDMDEFLAEVEWAASECKQFQIEMDWLDPTPDYMEIGTMF